jgi:hypothetical protein
MKSSLKFYNYFPMTGDAQISNNLYPGLTIFGLFNSILNQAKYNDYKNFEKVILKNFLKGIQ